MNRFFTYSMLMAVLLLLVSGSLLAQVQRDIDIGNIRYTTRDDMAADDLEWPMQWRQPGNGLIFSDDENYDQLECYGYIIGVNMSWKDAGGSPWTKKIAMMAQNRLSDIKNITIPSKFTRTFKYRPPNRIVGTKNWTDVTWNQDPVDPAAPSDVVIYTKMTTWTGIDVERWMYGFGNPKYDDFVIQEWKYTNSSTEDRKDVYIAVIGSMASNGHYPGDNWGQYYGGSYKEYAAGNKSADSLRMFYAWDADIKGSTHDDKGNPDLTWGYLKCPTYASAVVLHADKSTSDETDDPGQPVKGGWSQREKLPDLAVSTHDGIYNMFLSPQWDPTIPSLVTYKNEGWYRILPPTWNPLVDDPNTEQEKSGVFIFGPYQMKPGEDVRFVTAMCVASINPRVAIDAGWAYNPGLTSLMPRKPMPYAYGNFINKGDLLTRAQKDKLIDTGKDSVFNTAGLAKTVWKSSNVKYGKGTFNIDFPPPSPNLTVKSMIGNTSLVWGDQAEKAGTIKGYRVYRNFWRPPEWTWPSDTNFVLIKDNIPPGTLKYDDSDVIAGESYYYIVTAVSLKGVESSKTWNRTGYYKTGTDRLLESATSSRAPDETGWKENVVVVPNPYHARAVKKYTSTKLNFFNLPSYCNIHIYTMTGDKVQTIKHVAGTGEQNWDRQDTFDTMQIISGIYFFVVEELDGPSGQPTGEIAKGKFVVVK